MRETEIGAKRQDWQIREERGMGKKERKRGENRERTKGKVVSKVTKGREEEE